MATEQTLEEAFGVTVTLADDRAMAQEVNPFQTIGSLADYAAGLVDETRADG